MLGVLEGIFALFSGTAGPVFLSGAAGLLLWAAVERRLRRRASREREAWRNRALDAEQWAEAASRISRGHAPIDARTAAELEAEARLAEEADRRIRAAAAGGAGLLALTRNFFGAVPKKSAAKKGEESHALPRANR